MTTTDPLTPFIGREKLLAEVLARLQQPDDVREDYQQRVFHSTGFHGLGGSGKSRLLRELDSNARALTPYVVRIDFDPRTDRAVPGTPLDLIRALIDALDQQDQAKRPIFRKSSAFDACRRLIRDFQIPRVEQTIIAKDSHLTGITQQANIDELLLPQLAPLFNAALANLYVKGQTLRQTGRVGKANPRPLILILLDTLDLAPRPVRDALKQLRDQLGGRETLKFHAVWVLAGRQAIPDLLDRALPPLTDREAAILVRTYAGRLFTRPDWRSRFDALHELQNERSPLTASVVKHGQGLPLLLQLLSDVALLDPRAVAGWSDELPPDHDTRLDYVLQHYLDRLRAAADGNSDEALWQSLRLLKYAAVPRRVTSVGLLQALLCDLPGTPFDARTNYDALYQQLRRESFIEPLSSDELRYHQVIRAGALAYLRDKEPDTCLELHQRAARWFAARGDEVERLYHAVQCDYAGAIGALMARIDAALNDRQWAAAQTLIEALAPLDLTPDDAAWLTVSKAQLAWGEGNSALAWQRVRSLYDRDFDPALKRRLAQIVETWLGIPTDVEERARQHESIQLASGSLFDVGWWAAATSSPALQANALLGLGEVALRQARLSEAEGYYRRALAGYEAIDSRLGQADALGGLGEVALRQDRLSEADGYFRRALEASEAIEDQLGQAAALHCLGAVALRQDRLTEADGYYRRVLGVLEAIEDRRRQAHVLADLGEVARLQARLDEADGYYRRALAVSEAIEHRRGQANALAGLGEVALAQNRLAEADGYYRRALGVSEVIKDRHGQAVALVGLGDAARMQARLADADGYYRRALGVSSEAIEHRRMQACALWGLGAVALRQDRLTEADGYYRRALEVSEAIEDRLGQVNALRGQGDVALVQDRLAEANGYYRRALGVSEAIKDQLGQANVLRGLGAVALRQDRLTEADGYYRRALAVSEAIADRQGQAHALLGLGEVAVAADHYPAAQASLEQALYLYQAIGDWYDVMRFSLLTANAVLDKRESHWRQGQAQLAGQAFALAQRLLQAAEEAAGQLGNIDQARELMGYLQSVRQRLLNLE